MYHVKDGWVLLSRMAWAREVSSCLRGLKTSVMEVQGEILGRPSPEPLTDSLILRLVSANHHRSQDESDFCNVTGNLPPVT